MGTKPATLRELDWVGAVPAFQAALRGLLGGYLDSPRRSLSVVGRPTNLRGVGRYYLGPVKDAVRELVRLEAPELDLLVKLEAAIQGLLGQGEITDRELAQTLAAGYRAADALLEGAPAGAVRVECFTAPEPIDAADYRAGEDGYLAPVLGLDRFARRALRPDLAGLFLHGSLATLDYARDYSDFDTLMVLRRETVTCPERLLDFLKRYRRSLTFIYQFDPLQHHGHIVVTEIDLGYYPHSFFPLSVLEYARSLGGTWEGFEVRSRDDAAEMRDEFGRVCGVFRRRAAEGYRPKDAFELKNFLSELMLLPALYCQCLGSPCYKKYSFERARPDFSDAEWQVMAEATDVRVNWRHGRKTAGLLARTGGRLGMPEFVKRFGDNRASDVVAMAAGRLSRDYVEAAARLAEAMLRRITERVEGPCE